MMEPNILQITELIFQEKIAFSQKFGTALVFK